MQFETFFTESVQHLTVDFADQGCLQTPLFAQGATLAEQLAWLNAYGDPSQLYVLANGYAYAYTVTQVPGYTNAVATSLAHDSDDVFNGVGYQDGLYLSAGATGNVSTDANYTAVGYIPYQYDTAKGRFPTIYVQGLEWVAESHTRLYLVNEKKVVDLGQSNAFNFTGANSNLTNYFTMETLADGSWKLTPKSSLATAVPQYEADIKTAKDVVRYIRFSLKGKGANLIISLDNPIGMVEGHGWVNTGVLYGGGACNTSPLFGKTVVFAGDSICDATTDTSGQEGWAGRIGRKHSMRWNNAGISGGTLTRGLTGSAGCIADTDFGAEPDYIILQGGTNDADLIGGKDTGGNMPAKYGAYGLFYYEHNFDATTFCGAVEALFRRVTTDYEGAKIGFIISHKMGGYSANDGYYYDAEHNARRFYFETIIALCKKWGIPYLDLWEGSYLNPMNSKHNSGADPFYYNSDYQHLTARGYDYITPMIEKWMETL